MKILVLTTCYPRRSQPFRGVFIHGQLRALAELGVDCHVLQPIDWSPPAPLHRLKPHWRASRAVKADSLAVVDGIPVHHPSVFQPLASRLFPGDYWTRVGRAVGRYVQRHHNLRNADLMYAHFLCDEGYAGLVATGSLKMPLAAIARGDDVHAWPERWPDRKSKLAAVLRGADGLLACSRSLAEDAAQWATEGLARPIEVVYNGVDVQRFAPTESAAIRLRTRQALGLPTDKKLLLCVATPTRAKGWLELLDAFASLDDVALEWHLVMVGFARNQDELDLPSEAFDRGLGGRATWLGCLPPNEMPDLYRAADAFALASYNEGLSNAVVEAMASGLPVVATRVGGHAEFITDGIHGRLVPPRDVASLARALAEVCTDPEAARRMGRAARQAMLELGDQRQNAKRLLEYFEDLLDRRRGLVSSKVHEQPVGGS